MSFTPLRNYADAEAVTRDILLAAGVSVGANVPADLLSYLPYISARRIGGAAVLPRRLDRASMVIDCWSAGRPTASAMAETCRALLEAAHAQQTAHAGGTIASYAEITAPSEIRTDGQPDGVCRFSLSVSLYVRPV